MKSELNFLSKSSLAVAPQLLGWKLCRQTPEGVVRLMIVETEAYHQDDAASHSFRGLTPRTAPMFEEGGRIYVYFTYGMHYCLNIVTGLKGRGEAVLIRAGQPLDGIEIMQKNRSISALVNLANGPGKLTQALGITSTKISGELLNKSSIFLEPPPVAINMSQVVISPRVGIKKAVEQPWRFHLKDNPYVSRYTNPKAR